jgi:hypothetical protein
VVAEKRSDREPARKTVVFNALRQALSITQVEGEYELNDDGNEPDIKTIEEKVKAFRKWGDYDFVTITNTSTSSVPEPSTAVLLGMGFIGMCSYGWRYRRQ